MVLRTGLAVAAVSSTYIMAILVGPGRVELPDLSRLSGVRSNHLSYEPFSRNET